MAFGLCASGVVLGFVLGGFQGALGAFAIAVGITAVRHARRRRASLPRLACRFLVLGGGDQPIAAMLFRMPDDDAEEAADHLREHGWSTLEPPFDGPLAPVNGVGVEFRGDRGLVVHDLRGLGGRPSLIADRLTALPPGWGRAAEESGYVLLLTDDGRSAPGWMPVLGAYALLRGTRAGG
ncbi:hypothetical protein J7E45_09935 [Microbacterium sp. ISL-59]|uniref:hypothetical protein n=1 Tax=Microbacterium sp. ISL-59 TaxID=2819159 RepID=UPI001BE81839|nr:hypothetical protein [Microbacterium sp. ISL-59]MBT2495928.1 hypothetical protein [Microbacterium sp. ISL-59]